MFLVVVYFELFFTILICRPSTPVFDPQLGQTKCYQIVIWWFSLSNI